MEDNEETKMDALTKEQIEYVRLKTDINELFTHFKLVMRDGSMMFTCHPSPKQPINDMSHVTTKYFYLCMEILQGKHNEFLKDIIEKTEKRDKNQSN